MSDRLERSWRSWLPTCPPAWLRARGIRREIRDLDRYYGSLVAKARGDEEQALLAEWSFEVQEPQSRLGQLETDPLRRLAERFLLDCPSSEQNRDTGLFYIPDALRRKLKREIRDARRERVRWWVQAVVMPLIGLLGVAAALLSVYLTLRLN